MATAKRPLSDYVDQFEVDGVPFRLAPLDAMQAQMLALNVLQPLGLALQGVQYAKNIPAMLGSGVLGLAKSGPEFQQLVNAFKAVTLVCHDRTADGDMLFLPLDGLFNQVFRRKHMLMVGWIAECLKLEYADFLLEITPHLEKAKAMYSKFRKDYETNGSSGESSLTSESPTD